MQSKAGTKMIMDSNAPLQACCVACVRCGPKLNVRFTLTEQNQMNAPEFLGVSRPSSVPGADSASAQHLNTCSVRLMVVHVDGKLTREVLVAPRSVWVSSLSSNSSKTPQAVQLRESKFNSRNICPLVMNWLGPILAFAVAQNGNSLWTPCRNSSRFSRCSLSLSLLVVVQTVIRHTSYTLVCALLAPKWTQEISESRSLSFKHLRLDDHY